MAHDFARHELTAFAAATRQLMAVMLHHERILDAGGRTVTGGFGVSIDRGAVNGGFDDRWTAFKEAAGDEIITALRAHIVSMPSGIRIKLWLDANGHVTRLWLDHSSGDAKIDAIAEQLLRHLCLAPPPPDLPMPLVLSAIIAPGAWIFALDEEAP